MKNRTETGQWNKQGTAVKLGKDDVRYWKSRLKKRSYKSGGKTVEIKEWQVRLFSGSSEEWFNLGTQNQAAAARHARDIYLHLRANGMAETVARFKAKPQEETKVSTFLDGGFFSAILYPGAFSGGLRLMKRRGLSSVLKPDSSSTHR
ncbi:hypothetical protein [Rubritalea marina]|uniref:hypothetical protein n=1 Tax=Rubritalea marina TaxID=361055 RepID=UPI0012E9D4D8|nr:hypothetical protein [Rubritalea marina]